MICASKGRIMKLDLREAVLALTVVAVAGLAGCQEDPAEAHRLKGNELFKKEQWTKAAEEYRLSLEADPKQEKLWDKLAAAHMRAGQTDEAVQALLKTIDFRPDPQKKAEVYRNIGGLLLQSPKPFDAEQYFLEAVKLAPNDDASLLWLGEMESQRGGARNMQAAAVREHLDKAVAYYDQVITAKPDALVAYVNKRIALIKLMNEEKRQKEAAEGVALAIRRNTAQKQEALSRVAHHQARIDELKAKADELSAKITELQKKGVKLK
jgi:tetratricopeptide (TPR) repeat protein